MLHAVVVGIGAYADSKIKPLAFARADAEAFAATLGERADRERQVTLLVDDRATKARIARIITDELPRAVRQDDSVILYFAAYGSPEIEVYDSEPSIHLVVHDTVHARLHATSINMISELSAWARRLPARLVTLILDASFNGMPGGRTFEGPGLWSGPRTRSLDRISLRRVAVGGHFALLAACTEKEVAREDPTYGHGVFTHHLISALKSPELDDRTVTVSMLHASVTEAVRTSTNGDQVPLVYGGGAGLPLFRVERRTSRVPTAV